MEFKKFSHLSSFALAGLEVPVKKIKTLLSTRLQLDLVGYLLVSRKDTGLSLSAIREPTFEKVNYLEKTRGIVYQVWHPVADNLSGIAPSQLLERLNTTWNVAQKKIAIAVDNARETFNERARLKAEIIREECSSLASEKGIPAVLDWMDRLNEETSTAREALENELRRFEQRRQRQKQNLEVIKAEWMDTLGKSVDFDAQRVARNFLILATIIILVGVGLWIFSIPANSIVGILGIAVTTLIAMKFISPLIRHLSLSRQMNLLANKLLFGYKALSLFEFDERVKKLEIEYTGNTLRTLFRIIREEYEKETATLEEIQTELKSEVKELEKSLLESPPTIRPIVRDDALREWYEHAQKIAPLNEWIRRLSSPKDINQRWAEIKKETERVFSFLDNVKVEEELYLMYQNKEERMELLNSLKEAAIGRTSGEAFVSLDSSVMTGSPEVYLIIEVYNPEESFIAKEIREAWGNTGIGLSIVAGSNPETISIIGVTYGFPLEAIREWEEVENSFNQLYKQEGNSIYPFLLPKEGETQ